ncbi:MAG TPA: adenine phosphoribosyltransferase [Candidatus Krumholzibacteria bacterium]|nr:adenine phosphoribosyltransferase [Candidatus Krumholzibacteria bacterium]
MSTTAVDRIRAAIRDVPDFPKPGIIFKDITPILGDPTLFGEVVRVFVERYRPMRIQKIAAMESRGFIFGAPLAAAIGAGFVPLRKHGKLPHTTLAQSFTLEYGEETLEIHTDAIRPGERVLVIDDLLATGGTAAAAVHLINKTGGHVVELAFLIELAFLKGRERLSQTPTFAMIRYD